MVVSHAAALAEVNRQRRDSAATAETMALLARQDREAREWFATHYGESAWEEIFRDAAIRKALYGDGVLCRADMEGRLGRPLMAADLMLERWSYSDGPAFVGLGKALFPERRTKRRRVLARIWSHYGVAPAWLRYTSGYARR